MAIPNNNLKIQTVKISELKPSKYNPRKWSDKALADLKESLKRFGTVDPLIVNGSSKRKNILIGGHMRLEAMKQLKYEEAPVVYLNLPDETKERELNVRLNKNLGQFDLELLSEFDASVLSDIGFESEELDEIFDVDPAEPEQFNITKELEKLNIKKVNAKKGQVYQLGENRLMIGDSTLESNVMKLMNGEQADMCMTDPPYLLDYLKAKRHGKPTTGFGAKRNRRYLETDVLPDDFTDKWMDNIAKVAKSDFSIICFENWKNIPVIWAEMEKHWKIKNMIVWHVVTRHQGFALKYKFFSKHDIAMVGANGAVEYNHDEEPDGLQEEYETALYAVSGHPQWESYSKNKRVQPTDFISHNASDEKNSGQGVVFGTKPIPVLLPYIKVLTKRGDLVVEPFGGSGSTLIASEKLKRRCYVMEKVPEYAEVIMKRWEKLTGQKRKLLND